ncbi:MAG: hypothetical protein ACMXX8_01550 [Candidatus Woesearchaeota archaeon]
MYFSVSNVTSIDFSQLNKDYWLNNSHQNCKMYVGGVRKELFGVNSWLTKCNFNKGYNIVHSHLVQNSKIYYKYCIIKHLLFDEEFLQKVAQVCSTQEYYNNSYEYQKILTSLESCSSFSPKKILNHSIKYSDMAAYNEIKKL